MRRIEGVEEEMEKEEGRRISMRGRAEGEKLGAEEERREEEM